MIAKKQEIEKKRELAPPAPPVPLAKSASVTISNLKFADGQMNKLLPRACEKFLINKTKKCLYNTRGNFLDVLQGKTTTYGSNSFTLHAICTWSFLQNKISITTSPSSLTLTKFLKVIKTYISEKT